MSETTITLSHIGLCVSDLERSLRFYCEGLGFEEKTPYRVGNEYRKLLELDGEILHTDDWLSDEDKAANKKIMPCVSRAKCSRLVIDC